MCRGGVFNEEDLEVGDDSLLFEVILVDDEGL
jgi:hypothetical protein